MLFCIAYFMNYIYANDAVIFGLVYIYVFSLILHGSKLYADVYPMVDI